MKVYVSETTEKQSRKNISEKPCKTTDNEKNPVIKKIWDVRNLKLF